MEIPHPCPLLSPIKIQHSKWELDDLLEMEIHINTQANCQHPELKTWVLSEPFKGSTPLLIACDKGNLDSVKRIVEKWQMEVNSTGVYYYFFKECNHLFPEFILEASPLFVAAYRCHYEIVRYLVEKGANIFAKTSNDDDCKLAGLTPLYGSVASSDSTISTRKQDAIVRFFLESAGSNSSALALLTALQKKLHKPIWKMRGCGPAATITLIKYGMSVNKHYKFRTILTHWASKSLGYYNDGSDEGSLLELIQLLVEKGADLVSPDLQGRTPIFLSAMPGFHIRSLNFSVFDFLLEREEIGRLDKINALELAGAVILSFSSDPSQIPLAFAYWRRAHHLRYQMGVDPIPKTPLIFKKVPQRVEWTTLPQLEEIEKDPSLHKIASLLVHLRISVFDEWRYGYPYLHQTPVDLVIYHYEEGLHQGFTEAADSFFIVLEFILKCNNRRQFNLWWDTVKLDKKLVSLLNKNPHRCTSEILQTSAELITAADQSHLPELNSNFSRIYVNILSHVKTLLRFVSVLADHPDKMNDGIVNSLTQLVKQDGRTKDGSNLLLLTCSYAQCNDLPPVVRLLLRARANPNAVDLRLRGPLHILAGFNYAHQERIDHLGNLLVNKGAVDEGNCGAHPYMVDDEGRTAADIWLLLRNQGPRLQEDHRVWDRTDVPEWCLEKVPKLACLSAKIVRRFRIPCDEIPATLYPFMEKH